MSVRGSWRSGSSSDALCFLSWACLGYCPWPLLFHLGVPLPNTDPLLLASPIVCQGSLRSRRRRGLRKPKRAVQMPVVTEDSCCLLSGFGIGTRDRC